MHNIRGYITEKIHHCFFAGSVPIYWGASNITDYIPAHCFIDRRNFSTEQELYHALVHMPESEYENYIKNIENYLQSPQFLLFSSLHFVECLLKNIIPDYDRKKACTQCQISMLEMIDSLFQK